MKVIPLSNEPSNCRKWAELVMGIRDEVHYYRVVEAHYVKSDSQDGYYRVGRIFGPGGRPEGTWVCTCLGWLVHNHCKHARKMKEVHQRGSAA